MRFQTNPALGPFLNAWGCHVTTILEKVEKKSGYAWSWSDADTVIVYQAGIANGAIQREVKDGAGNPVDGCDVLDGVKFFNLAAEMAGIPDRLKEYAHLPKDYVCQPGEEEILECARDGHPGFHFMSGNGVPDPVTWQNEIEFDPWEGGSMTARVGYIVEKRILRFV